jgi:hypothetical protein
VSPLWGRGDAAINHAPTGTTDEPNSHDPGHQAPLPSWARCSPPPGGPLPLAYCPRSSLPAAVLAWLAARLAHLVPARPPGTGGTPPLSLEVRLHAAAAVLLDGLSYRRAGRAVGISKTEVGDSLDLLLGPLGDLGLSVDRPSGQRLGAAALARAAVPRPGRLPGRRGAGLPWSLAAPGCRMTRPSRTPSISKRPVAGALGHSGWWSTPTAASRLCSCSQGGAGWLELKMRLDLLSAC